MALIGISKQHFAEKRVRVLFALDQERDALPGNSPENRTVRGSLHVRHIIGMLAHVPENPGTLITHLCAKNRATNMLVPCEGSLPVAIYGDAVYAITGKQVPERVHVSETKYLEEVPCCSLDDVPTPSTPSSDAGSW